MVGVIVIVIVLALALALTKKEVQRSTSTDIRLQPDFKFDISFKNDSRDGAAPDTSDPLWLPAPPPPSAEDQRFLGDSTDGVISSLKEGEPTPFYISFLSPNPEPNPTLTARDLLQRQSSSGVPDVLATIPLPETEADGSAKAANLIPLPTLQPLRLYDRGLPTEHYGFYTYFDRSIFLRSTLLLTETDRDQGPVPADLDGGSTKQEALRRCTWAQTRFLVQIWTNRGTRLLDRTTPSSTNDDDGNTDRNSAAPRSSDLARPGSFPYPVTLTTDRHGGDVSKKMIYCYALDERANIMPDRKAIQIENRGFGGRLVGGGQGPLGKDRVGVDEGGLGGIDGGTGGCSCRWSNAVGGA
ncbi:MAG: hypothetical protein M1817_000731 [Caeruleum heppii]|nr:MAG: hypothetical protein M1817_000731 [Caeruleum heppii]